MHLKMMEAFKTIGQFVAIWCAGYGATKLTMLDYDPMEGYDSSKDSELIQLQNRLRSESKDRFDQVYIDNLRRCNIGKMYRLDFLNGIFKSNGGYIGTWYDSEKKLRFRALVRSDGKLLSTVDECGIRYERNTVLTAKVVDGYLVGVAENVYFSGKGNYPFYKFKD